MTLTRSIPLTARRPVVPRSARRADEHALLAIQRAAGNRAAARVATGEPLQVQRLRKAAEFDRKTVADQGQETELAVIRLRLAGYHAIDPRQDPNHQRRLRALNALDQAIHGWFDLHVTDTIAGTPNGAYLQELLGSSEREHRRLVAAVAGKPNQLPIDTSGMTKEQIDETRELWRSIVNGDGNIRIAKRLFDGGFNDRMLANMAKLLQTPAGADLLRDINTMGGGDPGKRVEIGPTFEKELKALGKPDPNDSQAVPKTVGDDVTSMAFNKRGDLPDGAKMATYSGPAEAGAFNRFLTTLAPDVTHFGFNGTIYKVGVGVGSYVKMAGKGELHANVGVSGGGHREVLVPEFITLGHELAHSQRQLRGTTVPFSFDFAEFGFTGGAAERKMWNNAEEYINIAGPENALRAQHGMATRSYHSGDLGSVNTSMMRERIEQLLNNGENERRQKRRYDAVMALYKKSLFAKTDEERSELLSNREMRVAVEALEAALAQQPVWQRAAPTGAG